MTTMRSLLTFFTFIGCPLLLLATASAQNEAVIPSKKDDKWTQSSPMPKVVVAKLNKDGNSIDVLESVQSYVNEVVTYTVQVPQIQDGKTTFSQEQRQRTVTKCVSNIERRNIKMDQLAAFAMDGTELSSTELGRRLKMPIHVLFGNKPDAYARAVFKDDLTVIVENKPDPPIPAPMPAPAPTPTKP